MTTELDKLFPDPVPDRAPTAVAEALDDGERLVWLGGPDRWGLFRATPFVIAIGLTAVGSIAMTSGSGLTSGEYLWRLAGSLGADPALVVAAAAVLFVGLLTLSLRDPRSRWTYVVTDRRLLTFHDGRKLRELPPDRIRRLRVLRGIEGRLRNVGDVVWSQVASSDDNVRGPDQGRHGFRGMRDPERWHERLQQWAEAVERIAADDARTFSAARDGDPEAGPAPNDDANEGSRRLENRRFDFAITLPSRWVGRIGVEEKTPLTLLGMRLPIPTIDRVVDRPLHDPPDAWNFIEVQGRSGMKFTMKVGKGAPPITFEKARAAAGDSLVDANGDLRCGALSGFRVDYRHRDKVYIRRAVLEGGDCHAQIIVALPDDQAPDLLPMIDAVFDSIRAR